MITACRASSTGDAVLEHGVHADGGEEVEDVDCKDVNLMLCSIG